MSWRSADLPPHTHLNLIHHLSTPSLGQTGAWTWPAPLPSAAAMRRRPRLAASQFPPHMFCSALITLFSNMQESRKRLVRKFSVRNNQQQVMLRRQWRPSSSPALREKNLPSSFTHLIFLNVHIKLKTRPGWNTPQISEVIIIAIPSPDQQHRWVEVSFWQRQAAAFPCWH